MATWFHTSCFRGLPSIPRILIVTMEKAQIQQFDFSNDIRQGRIFPMRSAKMHTSGEVFIPQNNRLTLTDQQREENLGLDAIIIDWMVNDANKARVLRPPYGLIFARNNKIDDYPVSNIKTLDNPNLLGDPFSTFAFAMHHALAYSLEQKRLKVFEEDKI